MSGQLWMFNPLTSLGLHSAISLQASAAGRTLLGSLAGRTTVRSGLEVAPASRSRAPAPKLAGTIPAIFGRRGFSSSASAALTSSLVSKLKQRLPTPGSTVFAMIWKAKATPSGRLVCLLRALGHRTSGSDSGSWPKEWATPAARDWISESATDDFNAKRWGHKRGKPLSAQVMWQAAWPTPTALSPATKDYNEAGDSCNLRRTRLLVSGLTATGSPAETAKPGQLNPSLSRWLMGLPQAWDFCALRVIPTIRTRNVSSLPRSSKKEKRVSDGSKVTATPSSRKPRKSSSKRI